MRNPTISEIIRVNLLRIMAEKMLKNKDLAKILDVSPSYVTNILKEFGNTKRGIGQVTLDKLCKGLNINQDEFYKGIYVGEKQEHDVCEIKFKTIETKTQEIVNTDTSLLGIAKYVIEHGTVAQYERFRSFGETIKREIESTKKGTLLKNTNASDSPPINQLNGLKVVNGSK
jgi:DNA-binding Xre family transcriptional regulator